MARFTSAWLGHGAKHVRVAWDGVLTLNEINIEIGRLALHTLGAPSASVKGPKR